MATLDEVQQLAVFTILAKERHFTRAADKLGISKSQVSKQISALEKRLGLELVIRNTRSVSLTKLGIEYASSGTKMLNHFYAAEAKVSNVTAYPADIELWLEDSIDLRVVTKLTTLFRNFYPLVQFTISRTNSINASSTQSGLLFYTATQRRNGKAIALKEQGYKMVASAEFVNRNGKPKTPTELSQFTFIARERDDVTSNSLKLRNKESEEVTTVFTEGYRFQSLRDIRDAVSQNMGIAVLPEHLISEKMASGEFQSILTGWTPAASESIYLEYRAIREINTVEQQFLDTAEYGT
ncbi:hypothetical protein CS022_02780 [Veronia nyctiphanis]|uniref:HTH lysR-type domain-containing protein n=1 Tax=Veronia nyctiphanis TaxID=1278244 RepID=A0A4V1LTA5_9GAMM|nr:LysR family transcriptional regulator [Veronia nyctiphanis]RXJ74518.1 hypothetical protein CS022_02780 [Veronia nyctiphanis]